jgi:hypothetical protein
MLRAELRREPPQGTTKYRCSTVLRPKYMPDNQTLKNVSNPVHNIGQCFSNVSRCGTHLSFEILERTSGRKRGELKPPTLYVGSPGLDAWPGDGLPRRSCSIASPLPTGKYRECHLKQTAAVSFHILPISSFTDTLPFSAAELDTIKIQPLNKSRHIKLRTYLL